MNLLHKKAASNQSIPRMRMRPISNHNYAATLKRCMSKVT